MFIFASNNLGHFGLIIVVGWNYREYNMPIDIPATSPKMEQN
jgi:hypothetical protein